MLHTGAGPCIHLFKPQDGFSSRIHSTRIFRAQNAGRSRRRWKSYVPLGSKSPAHMATALFHAYRPPEQSKNSLYSVNPIYDACFSQDKSFTCTLFAPTAEFERLRSREAILPWFKEYFPDALSLIGPEVICKNFERNPRSPLITTRVGCVVFLLLFCG